MAFYCLAMFTIALELAADDPSYEDMASNFFEHYVAIVAATADTKNGGLWDEQDGFYYDQFQLSDGRRMAIRLRSYVGLLPLIGATVIDSALIQRFPTFLKRAKWFFANRPELTPLVSFAGDSNREKALLAIPSRDQLVRVLRYMLDENEFLSDYGIRSLSRRYDERPYRPEGVSNEAAEAATVHYTPGEGDTAIFGGNSNWRGPIWLPINFLLIQSLRTYHAFYRDTLTVEFPTGSGKYMNLLDVSNEISKRLATIFLADSEGKIAWQGDERIWADDPAWQGLSLFHEHFDGDTGRGLGASHQTGWTALIALLIENKEIPL
jgi:hypothetical protein